MRRLSGAPTKGSAEAPRLRRSFGYAASVVAALPALAPRLTRRGHPDMLLALVALAAGAAGAAAPLVVPWREAGGHVGEVVTVEGEVAVGRTVGDTWGLQFAPDDTRPCRGVVLPPPLQEPPPPPRPPRPRAGPRARAGAPPPARRASGSRRSAAASTPSATAAPPSAPP